MNWAPLFFLWALSQTGSGSNGGDRKRRNDPFDYTPIRRPVGPGPSPAPSPAPGPATPVSYGGGGSAGAWTPYKPLTPEVIARSQALLADPTKVEVIEEDPTHPGRKVRYLRVPNTPAPGKTSVWAYMPRAGSPAASSARVTT